MVKMDSAEREDKPSKLEKPFNEEILCTACKDETLVLGTANGKLILLDMSTNKHIGEPVRIGGESQTVNKVVAIPNIEASLFLVVVDNKELYFFDAKESVTRPIDFKANLDSKYHDGKICNIQVSQNSKFFAIGILDRAFGIFKLDKETLKVEQPKKWVTKVSLFASLLFLSTNSSTSKWMRICRASCLRTTMGGHWTSNSCCGTLILTNLIQSFCKSTMFSQQSKKKTAIRPMTAKLMKPLLAVKPQGAATA